MGVEGFGNQAAIETSGGTPSTDEAKTATAGKKLDSRNTPER